MDIVTRAGIGLVAASPVSNHRVARSRLAGYIERGRSMTDKAITRTSKFLSLILRHEPERVGLKLDSAGWVAVDELLEAVKQNGVSLTLDQLK